jgi:hypothetical protein
MRSLRTTSDTLRDSVTRIPRISLESSRESHATHGDSSSSESWIPAAPADFQATQSSIAFVSPRIRFKEGPAACRSTPKEQKENQLRRELKKAVAGSFINSLLKVNQPNSDLSERLDRSLSCSPRRDDEPFSYTPRNPLEPFCYTPRGMSLDHWRTPSGKRSSRKHENSRHADDSLDSKKRHTKDNKNRRNRTSSSDFSDTSAPESQMSRMSRRDRFYLNKNGDKSKAASFNKEFVSIDRNGGSESKRRGSLFSSVCSMMGDNDDKMKFKSRSLSARSKFFSSCLVFFSLF